MLFTQVFYPCIVGQKIKNMGEKQFENALDVEISKLDIYAK